MLNMFLILHKFSQCFYSRSGVPYCGATKNNKEESLINDAWPTVQFAYSLNFNFVFICNPIRKLYLQLSMLCLQTAH